MQELKTTKSDLYKTVKKGHLYVRRKDRNWSGVWSDMQNEQSLMKCFKSRSGIAHGENVSGSQRNLDFE